MTKVDAKTHMKFLTLTLKELTEMIKILQFWFYFKFRKIDVRLCKLDYSNFPRQLTCNGPTNHVKY